MLSTLLSEFKKYNIFLDQKRWWKLININNYKKNLFYYKKECNFID